MQRANDERASAPLPCSKAPPGSCCYRRARQRGAADPPRARRRHRSAPRRRQHGVLGLVMRDAIVSRANERARRWRSRGHALAHPAARASALADTSNSLTTVRWLTAHSTSSCRRREANSRWAATRGAASASTPTTSWCALSRFIIAEACCAAGVRASRSTSFRSSCHCAAQTRAADPQHRPSISALLDDCAAAGMPQREILAVWRRAGGARAPCVARSGPAGFTLVRTWAFNDGAGQHQALQTAPGAIVSLTISPGEGGGPLRRKRLPGHRRARPQVSTTRRCGRRWTGWWRSARRGA